LDNQKIDGKTPSDGACACDISIHPELSPDSPAAGGAKGLAGTLSRPSRKLTEAAACPFSPSKWGEGVRSRMLLHVSFDRTFS
ncbi:hypothetical protein, partial [Sinorhizobium meliloti]